MSWAERDARVLWHPYTQAELEPPPLAIVRGEGAWLEAEDGSRYLDAISSWWTCVHGHAHPRLSAAISQQAATLEHVIFAGVTHPAAVELAERLTALLGLDRVFYSDNGSTAVEVAIKMAFQYWANRGAPRTRFLKLEGAYHGDTVGAMSVGGVPLFHEAFSDLLFRADTYDGEVGPDVAAVIVEPMVQGAGGMRVQRPEFLAEVAERCAKAETLLIADEVMTGFGRTGKMFACEHAGVRPDIVCLSKGLSGGVMPFAATVAREEIFEAFCSKDARRTFFHGHSFTGNPLGCAVALESLRIFEDEPVLERSRTIGERIGLGLEPLRGRVKELRGLGSIRAVELPDRVGGYLAEVGPRLKAMALERGVLLRPLGNVLYALPPLCLTDGEADRIASVMVELSEAVLSGAGHREV
ncbi:MAG: adenosylmethionine--8-amino-7-oxononanoate transaminase [Planctomycetota bacterium]|jgi:adenosylmethionine-8-amino-7-oxononanoate aminotransferase